MSGKVMIRPFEAADTLGLTVQREQLGELPADADAGDIAVALMLACVEPVSALCEDGKVRLIGGIVGTGHNVGLIALFGEDAGPWMLGIVRAVRAWLNDEPAHRIAMEVRADFDAGRRFAELLGFDAEGLMRARGPNREDYMLYARIAPEGAAWRS